MEFLTTAFLGTPVWMWFTFIAIVIGLLVLDLGILHKDGETEIGVTESLKLSAMYITLGLGFSGFVYWQMGWEPTAQYLTAFVVEKTLALDNIFVIALIFGFFAIPRAYQHRVLFWGILGVIVTGIKMLMVADKEHDIGENALIRLMRRMFNVTDGLRGNAFFVTEPNAAGKMVRFVTPLFLALVMIEVADLVFAVDSVPAVFTITTDPFIVYTSNIFAILGLRALYFALAAILHRFAYLKYALAVLLIFIGSKVFVADLMGWAKFPPSASLGITFAILGAGVVVSLWKTRGQKPVLEG